MPDHNPAPPFAHYSGPRNPRILFVGEAWGSTEAELGKPFCGESGKELFRMLGEATPGLAPKLHAQVCESMKYGHSWVTQREAWLSEARFAFTNVFAFRPHGNDIASLCSKRAELPASYGLPQLAQGKYIKPEFLPELDRLRIEIAQSRPNLLVALGNTACWALLQAANIGSIRGNVTQDAFGVKVLPTYHPAGVLRNWAWRPVVVMDLIKAGREGASPELVRPARRVHINPTLAEVCEWRDDLLAKPPELLSVDIETGAGQIKCIGFAGSITESFLVPFVDLSHPSGSYWGSVEDELEAWACVKAVLEAPIPKLGQNFIYDLQYITRMGILPSACLEDTMLLHHSLFPEMQKGLGFLGSIYTNEASWKLMNRRKVALAKEEKADE